MSRVNSLMLQFKVQHGVGPSTRAFALAQDDKLNNEDAQVPRRARLVWGTREELVLVICLLNVLGRLGRRLFDRIPF